MKYVWIPAVAMLISVALTPLLARLAPRVGLIDIPSSRKVHQVPVARVGGIPMVVGTVATLLLTGIVEPPVQHYLFGAAVLAIFGLWDDCREIGHYWKFVGQGAAVLPLVYSGFHIQALPFFGAIPPSVAMAVTGFAMVGLINAMNHSDGLDGLAGGEALITLAGVGLLSFVAGDALGVVLALAMSGALLGFLRHNNHPARVFMGDSGSQFLGFTLAFLLVHMERSATAVSPAAVLLLAGLPVIDILVVLAKRIRGGANWFLASRNHIHHRLLDAGAGQPAAVLLLYFGQVLFVGTGVLLREAGDASILGTYAIMTTGVFVIVRGFEQRRLRLLSHLGPSERPWRAASLPRKMVAVCASGYLLAAGVAARATSPEFALATAVVLAVLVAEIAFGTRRRSVVRRAAVYGAIAIVTYLGGHRLGIPPWVEVPFFAVLGLGTALAMAFQANRKRQFRLSPLDMITGVFFIGLLGLALERGGTLGWAVQFFILVYATEVFITQSRRRLDGISAASTVAVAAVAMKIVI